MCIRILPPIHKTTSTESFLPHVRLSSSHLCIFQNLHHRNRTFFLPRNCTILASTTTSHGTRIPIRNLKGIAQLRHQLKLRNGQLGACAWLQTTTSPLNRWNILRGQKVYNTSAVSVLCNSFRLWTDTLQGTNISPQKWHFEDDFPFPKVGYVNSLGGYLVLPIHLRGPTTDGT